MNRPPTAWTLTNSLAGVAGPIDTEAGDWFVTASAIGGATRQLLPAGQTTLATLTLTVAGRPGTYNVMLTEGLFIDEAMQTIPMSPPASLEIVVGGP